MAKTEDVVIRNERVAMMMVARDVLGMMFHRHYGAENGMPVATPDRELSKEEQGVYSSAIKYLTKEFNIGHREFPIADDKEKPEDPPGEKQKEPKPA